MYLIMSAASCPSRLPPRSRCHLNDQRQQEVLDALREVLHIVCAAVALLALLYISSRSLRDSCSCSCSRSAAGAGAAMAGPAMLGPSLLVIHEGR